MTSSTIRIWSTTKARLERQAKSLGISLPAMLDRLSQRETIDAQWKAAGDFYAKPEGRAFAGTARLATASSKRQVSKHR